MGLTAGNQREFSSQLTWREKLIAKMAMGGKLPACTCREVYRDDRVFLSLNPLHLHGFDFNSEFLLPA